jgi:hypothetical protein
MSDLCTISEHLSFLILACSLGVGASVSYYYCVFTYYYICVLIPLYMCPHTTLCVLILLHVSSYS